MDHNADIVEVSDPRDMTIDDPPAPDPHFQVVKGQPSVEEIAATIAMLASDYTTYLTGEIVSISSQRA